MPLDECRLRPGPRKVKQTLSLVVCFSAGSGKDRLFGVLPELVCFRHGTLAVARHVPILGCPPRQWPSGQNRSSRSSYRTLHKKFGQAENASRLGYFENP